MARAVWWLSAGVAVAAGAAIHFIDRAGPGTANTGMPRSQENITRTDPVISAAAPRTSSFITTDNAALAAFLDQGCDHRLSADFPALVPTVHGDAEIAAVVALVYDRNEGDTERHQGVELLRRSRYAALDDLCWTLVQSPDERERFRAFLTQYIGLGCMAEISEPRQALIVDRLRILLDDRHRAVRRQALHSLVRVEDEFAAAIVHAGLDDPKWRDCRDLIMQCAHALDDRLLIPAIRPLAYDEDVTSRVAAINVLGRWRDEVSRGAFAEAGESSILRVRRAAQLALAQLDNAKDPSLVEPVAFFVSRDD
jgi:hypothetical protein